MSKVEYGVDDDVDVGDDDFEDDDDDNHNIRNE